MVDVGDVDFLWFMSSDFFRALPQLLPRHRRQVVRLVIRHPALPEDKDNRYSLRIRGASAYTVLTVATTKDPQIMLVWGSCGATNHQDADPVLSENSSRGQAAR